MNKFLALILALLLVLVGCSHDNQKNIVPPAPQVEGQTISATSALDVIIIKESVVHPESVLFSAAHNAIFVSNITSGNPLEKKPVGYIGMYSPEGKTIKSPWIKGLRAPKGMAVFGDYLYVSDVDLILKISIKDSKVVKSVKVTGAKFLNDVTVDENGDVYISDMMANAIYLWSHDGEFKTWAKDKSLRSPNGLLAENGTLFLASWGDPLDPKTFTTVNPGAISPLVIKDSSSKVDEWTEVKGNLDGLTRDNDGSFWISDWITGDIFKLGNNKQSEKVFNYGPGVADIFYAKELGRLLVPQMKESKIIMIKI